MTFTYSAEPKCNYWDTAAYPSPNKTLPRNIPGCFAPAPTTHETWPDIRGEVLQELGGRPSSHINATDTAGCLIVVSQPLLATSTHTARFK